MKIRTPLAATTLLTAVVAALPPAAAAQQPDRPIEAEVREAVEAFRSALRQGDSTAVMSLLHPEVRVYEGGHAETAEEYRSGHLRADMAFLRAVDSELVHEEIVPGPDLAIYTSERRMTGTYRGRDIDSRSTETLVFVRTSEGWRIRHIHWSSR